MKQFVLAATLLTVTPASAATSKTDWVDDLAHMIKLSHRLERTDIKMQECNVSRSGISLAFSRAYYKGLRLRISNPNHAKSDPHYRVRYVIHRDGVPVLMLRKLYFSC